MVNIYDTIKCVKQPDNMKVQLYKHQLSSVYYMEKLEYDKYIKIDGGKLETTIGVHADQTGYGKTISMLALIVRDNMEWDITTEHVSNKIKVINDNMTKITKISRKKINSTLILTSSSIINQWYDEIINTTELSVIILNTRKKIKNTNFVNYDIVLISPSMYNILANDYTNRTWKRFVYDEPGDLKLISMKYINAGFIWLLTATPNSIVYLHKNCRTGYMYDMISCVKPWESFSDIFGKIIIKNSKEFIDYSFEMPSTINIYHECFSPIYDILKGLVNDKIIKMISAGNINEVINIIGGGKTNNLTLLIKGHKLSQLKKLIKLKETYNIQHNMKRMIQIDESMQRLNIQINDLDNRYINMMSTECNICLETIKNPVMEYNCQNLFCGECLLEWLKLNNSCPLCRHNVDSNKLVYIVDKQLCENKNIKNTCMKKKETKINTVINLIHKNPDGKFIIFSQWDKTFIPICNMLKLNNIKFIDVKGGDSARNNAINDYKKGDVNVIFLNANFNGSGVNLQETTDIIVYHKMNEYVYNQIVGRANRIGRTSNLRVHNLI